MPKQLSIGCSLPMNQDHDMKTTQIEISEAVAQQVAKRIEAGEFRDWSEYVAALIERDRQDEEMPQWMEDELVRRMEAADGGEGGAQEVTPAYWEQMRKDLRDRLRRARGEVA